MQLNDQAYAIAGMAARPEGLSAEEVRESIHPDDLPRVLASAQRALETGKPYDLQTRYRRGGEWRRVLARRVAQCNASGEAAAVVGVGLDLTDQLAESSRATESARHLEFAASAAGVALGPHL